MMKASEFAQRINQLAGKQEPFFFLLDFEMEKPFVCRLKEAVDHGVWFDVKGFTNVRGKRKAAAIFHPSIFPVSLQKYHEAFSLVMYYLQRGDTYLVNLTFPTLLEGDINLTTLFRSVQAPYKLFFRGQFLVFSPECFIRIENNRIYTYPMKGTIDASLPDAEKQLLSNPKEQFEHNTIVDLLRNDLAMVSERIEVLRYRYVDRIVTQQRELLQVSSEIAGNLSSGWQKQLGDMLVSMLPAGSVSGAPKQKTLEIIREAEMEKRGYYTGIFGIFDGDSLESAVNIRYIENTAQGLMYRSGGGITALSNEEEEYRELLNKVYVPAF